MGKRARKKTPSENAYNAYGVDNWEDFKTMFLGELEDSVKTLPELSESRQEVPHWKASIWYEDGEFNGKLDYEGYEKDED